MLLLSTLLFVLGAKKESPYQPAPPITLQFVTLKEQVKQEVKKEPKKSPPKPKPKPKKKVIPKPKPNKIPDKVIAEKVDPIKEEPIEEPIVDSTPTEEVVTETEVVETRNEARDALPQRISGAATLDNASFDPLFNPAPKYPAIAKRAGVEGYVDIDLIIDTKGHVKKYTIVSVHGHNSFAKETQKVIMQWRFPPPRIKGKPVTVKYVYRLKFVLH